MFKWSIARHDPILASSSVRALVGFVLFFALLSVAPSMVSGAPPGDASPPGPVTVTEEKTPNGHKAVRATFEIEGDADKVYQTLRDAAEFPEFMPNMKEVQVLESGPGYHVARFVGKRGMFESRMVVKRMFSDGAREITWYQLEGQAREIEGFWRVEKEDAEGRCRVTYQTYVDAGLLVPDAIVREYIKKGIGPMVSSLQKRVQSGGAWKSEAFLQQEKKRSASGLDQAAPVEPE